MYTVICSTCAEFSMRSLQSSLGYHDSTHHLKNCRSAAPTASVRRGGHGPETNLVRVSDAGTVGSDGLYYLENRNAEYRETRVEFRRSSRTTTKVWPAMQWKRTFCVGDHSSILRQHDSPVSEMTAQVCTTFVHSVYGDRPTHSHEPSGRGCGMLRARMCASCLVLHLHSNGRAACTDEHAHSATSTDYSMYYIATFENQPHMTWSRNRATLIHQHGVAHNSM